MNGCTNSICCRLQNVPYITPTYGTTLIADVKYTKIPNNMTVASKERYLELLIGHALTVNSSWKLLKYSHLLF